MLFLPGSGLVWAFSFQFHGLVRDPVMQAFLQTRLAWGPGLGVFGEWSPSHLHTDFRELTLQITRQLPARTGAREGGNRVEG